MNRGRVLWSRSVAWLWDGVILFLLNFVSFTRLSERQRTCWQIGLKTKAYKFTKVTILCSVWASLIVLWGLKLWNKPCFALNCDIVKNGRTAFTTVCNKKLNFWLSFFCSRGRDVVAKDTIWRGISSFTFKPIDRIGPKGAHVYQNPFITVSVKGTDKTFRSLDNWHLQSCIESANMIPMRKASTCCNSLPSCENYFRSLTRNENVICRSLRQN